MLLNRQPEIGIKGELVRQLQHMRYGRYYSQKGHRKVYDAKPLHVLQHRYLAPFVVEWA